MGCSAACFIAPDAKTAHCGDALDDKPLMHTLLADNSSDCRFTTLVLDKAQAKGLATFLRLA